MPTHEEDELFLDQYRKLTREQRALFRRAARELAEDADSGRFRGRLAGAVLTCFPTPPLAGHIRSKKGVPISLSHSRPWS